MKNKIKRDRSYFLSEIFDTLPILGFIIIILLIPIYPFVWVIKKLKKDD